MEIIARPAFSNRDQNPYNFLLYSSLKSQGVVVHEKLGFSSLLKSKVIHVHWPESFLNQEKMISVLLRALLLFGVVFSAKVFGLKLVWTVHNLKPHERRHPKLNAWFYEKFPKLCHGLIFLSDFTKNKAMVEIPSMKSVKSRVVLHGHYRDVFPEPKSRSFAKKELGINPATKVVLFFGMIRRYKNVPLLIERFNELNESGAMLIVAGSVVNDNSLEREILELSKGKENIVLDLNRISEEKLHLLISASDCIVLPYADVANSGSILLALSLNRMVLAPNKGSLSEIRSYVGNDYLHLYEGDFTRESLEDGLSNGGREREVDMSAFDWGVLAKQTHDFYLEL
ncbi:MAG: glycosyltransferase [bacterium]|nr:glycosyltransferase [bacterium]